MQDFKLTLRCNYEKIGRFRSFCKENGLSYQDVLRQAIDAAPEGRLKIKMRESEKKGLNTIYE